MKDRRGFTLIELLIVIAIIAILAGVVFVALDPLQRFRDARDSARWTDVTALVSAIKVNQVDNGGSYLAAIESASSDTNLMIGTATAGCNDANCTAVANTGDCIDLTSLKTQGYLGDIPVSPQESGTWDATLTGYYLSKSSTNGTVTVAACESGSGGTISVTR